MNILTVGVTTLPFSYEGPKRMRRLIGLEELKRHFIKIVVPSKNLLRSLMSPQVLSHLVYQMMFWHGVQSITDLMVRPGMINLDFADVETVKFKRQSYDGNWRSRRDNRAMAATELL